MPKKFIWLALLMGGLPMTILYTIDIVYKLHLLQRYPDLISTISTCLLFVAVVVYRWQFIKWIKATRESAENVNNNSGIALGKDGKNWDKRYTKA